MKQARTQGLGIGVSFIGLHQKSLWLPDVIFPSLGACSLLIPRTRWVEYSRQGTVVLTEAINEADSELKRACSVSEKNTPKYLNAELGSTIDQASPIPQTNNHSCCLPDSRGIAGSVADEMV